MLLLISGAIIKKETSKNAESRFTKTTIQNLPLPPSNPDFQPPSSIINKKTKAHPLIFGKIEYLNLLPFHVFMKRYARSGRRRIGFDYKKGVPSKINAEFAARRVDAAFISSIGAKGYAHAPLGIIAKKEVLSVLLLPGKQLEKDSESATSNVLAEVLGLKGEVLIGDKALRYRLGGGEALDLAKEWHQKYRLPFVFAQLCHHGHSREVKKLSKAFLRHKIHIPHYLLERASKRTGIKTPDIISYLTFISYNLDIKAKHGLNKFWRLSRIK
jgi:chorismate dehydratase